MFKDYDKYLSTSLKVYIFVLLCVFIMKIVGYVNNSTIISINDFCLKYHFDFVWYVISLYIQQYLFLGIVTNRRKLYIYSLIGTIITIIAQLIIKNSNNATLYYLIFSNLLFILYPMIIEKRIFIKRQILCILLIMFYQFISSTIRNTHLSYKEWNFIIDFMLITYNLVFMEGGLKLCQELEAGYSLLKKIHLKKLLKRLQENLHKFRLLPKEEKLSISIYIFLSLIWNTFTIVLIFIIAKLNNTLIECLFIVTSFWLSKHSFGKPFHLSSMLQCFIVSNISYYILNRITTPLGISIFVPILLGVGLSYLTSKLVKKTYKPLYKGMPKELFEETILKVTDKNSLKYKVCYDFYIRGKSDLSLSFEYNYSLPGIRKIKNRINDKIRELN